MSVHRFRVDELPAVPWKNGGGTTRQVASWPPGAGFDDFEWRVSMADITASGPFSAFPGVDRHILLLSGDGMRLHDGDGGFDHRLNVPFKPFAFSGDASVRSDMLGGISRDFNVMARRGRCHASVRVLDDAVELDAAAHGLLMVVAGSWRVNGDTLGIESGLWWAQEPLVWRLVPVEPGAKIIVVCFSKVEGNCPKTMSRISEKQAANRREEALRMNRPNEEGARDSMSEKISTNNMNRIGSADSTSRKNPS